MELPQKEYRNYRVIALFELSRLHLVFWIDERWQYECISPLRDPFPTNRPDAGSIDD